MIDIEEINIPQAPINNVPALVVAHSTDNALNGPSVHYFPGGKIPFIPNNVVLVRCLCCCPSFQYQSKQKRLSAWLRVDSRVGLEWKCEQAPELTVVGLLHQVFRCVPLVGATIDQELILDTMSGCPKEGKLNSPEQTMHLDHPNEVCDSLVRESNRLRPQFVHVPIVSVSPV